MSKSASSNLVRRVTIGVWTFVFVSGALWLWLFVGRPSEGGAEFDAAIGFAVIAGLNSLLLGIAVVVKKEPFSPLVISSLVVGFTVCGLSCYLWWAIDNFLSGL